MVLVLPPVETFGSQFAKSLSAGFGRGFEKSQDFKRQLALQSQKQNQSQDDFGTQSARDAINSIEELIGKKGIGLAGKLNLSEEARFNRGKFETLQAAVLPLFKSLFPRGMTEKEFKFVNDKYIPQPGDSEARIRGKLDGLKQFLNNSSYDLSGQSQQERPPLSSFHR